MSKTVLIVAHRFFPRSGAASLRLGRLSNDLVDRGLEVTVLTQAPPDWAGPSTLPREALDAFGLHPSVEVRLVAPASGEGGSGRRARNLARFGCAAAWWLLRRPSRYRALLVDPAPFASLPAMILARLRTRTCVVYYADSWAAMSVAGDSGRSRAAQVVLRQLEASMLRRADAVASVTPSLHSRAADLAPAAQHLYIPNGHLLQPRLETVTSPGRPWLIYVGNMGPAHGVPLLLEGVAEAWRRGSRFHVSLYGYGQDYEQVRRVVMEMRRGGVAIDLEGEVPLGRAFALIGAADGALVSLRPQDFTADSVPVKALCAMAQGTPLLAAGQGAFMDRVAGSGAGLVAAPTAMDIARMLETFCGSPEKYREHAQLQHVPELEAAAAGRRALVDLIQTGAGELD